MIAEAITDLLENLPATATLIQDRVYPATFAQSGFYPALTYNTRDMRVLPCRDKSTRTRIGLLEIGILANSTYDLQNLSELLAVSLSHYEGTHAGYFLQVEENADEYDENAEEIDALFKRIQFDLTVTKL